MAKYVVCKDGIIMDGESYTVQADARAAMDGFVATDLTDAQAKYTNAMYTSSIQTVSDDNKGVVVRRTISSVTNGLTYENIADLPYTAYMICTV